MHHQQQQQFDHHDVHQQQVVDVHHQAPIMDVHHQAPMMDSHHGHGINYARLESPQEMRTKFFQLFAQKAYEFKGKENSPRYGPVDIFHLAHHHMDRIHHATEEQMHHVNEHIACITHHDHREHHVYNPYTLDLGKWLPERVAKKMVPFRPELKQHFESRIGQLSHRHFTKVFGCEQQGNDLAVYFEYADEGKSLEAEILNRKKDKNPFNEDLLWKLLYSLTAAAQGVDPKTADYRPSKIFYRHFQASVNPQMLEAPQYVNREPCLFRNKNLGGAKPEERDSINVAYQIGISILCAGLLRTEKQINQDNLIPHLEDFGKLYGTQDSLLHFTLQELFLLKGKYTTNQIYSNIFAHKAENLLFLEATIKDEHHDHQPRSSFKEHLAKYFQQQEFSQIYFNFVHSHPTIVHKTLPMDFMDHYQENLYFVRAQVRYELDMAKYQHGHHDDVPQQPMQVSHHDVHVQQQPMQVSHHDVHMQQQPMQVSHHDVQRY